MVEIGLCVAESRADSALFTGGSKRRAGYVIVAGIDALRVVGFVLVSKDDELSDSMQHTDPRPSQVPRPSLHLHV